MADYIDQAYMELRYKNKTLVAQTNNIAGSNTGVIVSTVLDALISDATAEVDAIISRRYETPLTSPPADLKRATGDICYWEMVKANIDGDPRKVAMANFNDAMDYLNSLADGSKRLDGTAIKTVNDFYLKTGSSGSEDAELQEARYEEINWNYGNRIFSE